MADSGINYGKGGTMIYGPDGMKFFRAVTLASSLSLYAKTKMLPTRGVTVSKMLAMASEFTGKKYKRTQVEQAAADVREWAQAMKAALPKTDENGQPIP